MKQYKYKFSVVIPIYNVEEYLGETIESVINQTIGFEENIQMILVNDGSPDNSESICLKYKELYPNNIIYIKQKNGGVSSARNKGMKYIEGEYTNFLDSDDKWELDAFEKVYNFFELHSEEIDVVGVRQHFFEARTGYAPLDYKFNKDKVVDIFNHYNHIQMSVTSGFIRSSAIDIQFDTKVKYSEDAKFLIEIIMKKEKVGFIKSTEHLYRKRISETSAIQSKNYNESWYLTTPKLVYKYLFDYSKKKYGYVISYIQYFVMYDYQYRCKESIPSEISQKTIEEYKTITKDLLSEIDDIILLNQKLNPEYKVEFLKLKYGKDVTNKFQYQEHILYFNNIPVINLRNEKIINIAQLNISEDFLNFRGFINLNLPLPDYKINLVINNKERHIIDLKETNIYKRKFFGEVFIANKGFDINIPNKDIKTINFEIVYKNYNYTTMNFISGINAKIDLNSKIYYKFKDKIYYCYRRRIKVVENSLKNTLKFSLRRYKKLIVDKKWKILIVRILYNLCNIFKTKEIWLISDRPPVANDNGYALYKYINENSHKKENVYFVIEKNSRDFKKVKKSGKYLIYNSLKYKIYFLLADKLISSQADNWLFNPFGKSQKYYHDLYNADFIFLQHGIIINDLSAWLNKYDKKIKLFITSTQAEYDSIINGNYGFDKEIVKLTGMPRYDLLEDKKIKQIAIMPTWRMNLAGLVDIKLGFRQPNPNFKNSEYFKFYSKLINDERIITTLKAKDYKGIFLVHPSHYANANDFVGNNTISVEKEIANYNKIFCESSLVVTDYSSAPFDFAYLKKPVLYTQFDKEKFFSSHIYTQGYFSYEKDGFGPVVYDYESTVQEIIKFIENDCKLEEKYKKRIDKFYKYHDRNNCKRVYEEIKKL